MTVQITNESVLSSVGTQLWRYYDLEFDVESMAGDTPGEYEIIGSTERHAHEALRIKCKVFTHHVEDLYLWDGHGWIEPTTTPEQQEIR